MFVVVACQKTPGLTAWGGSLREAHEGTYADAAGVDQVDAGVVIGAALGSSQDGGAHGEGGEGGGEELHNGGWRWSDGRFWAREREGVCVCVCYS